MPRLANTNSRVTIHMVASLDGFIARKDGSVDWLETSDEFAGGDTMDPGFVEAFLKTIDCYVMGSRTYETALSFEAKGLGWSYGDKPTFVLTRRELPRTRETVEFYSGDLAQLVNRRSGGGQSLRYRHGGTSLRGATIDGSATRDGAPVASLLTLPTNASAKLPSRGMTTVEGTINGFPFRATLEPDGQRSHWLRVDLKIREAAGAEAGDVVTLEIAPSAEEPEPRVPADLRKALAV